MSKKNILAHEVGKSTFSYVEKKRIRKNFAKLRTAIDASHLLSMQVDSYSAFLQNKIPDVFNSVFPCISASGYAQIEYVDYFLGDPVFNVNECKVRGLTYSVSLKAKLRLTLFDKEKSDQSNKVVQNIKEQEIYIGELPIITDSGSFVINGIERVIVSQLHRSPGVFFDHDRGKTHSSGKLLYSARIIPYRGSWLDFEFVSARIDRHGSWLDFEFDPKDCLFARIDRRRKLPVTVLLKALGYSVEEILNIFFGTNKFKFKNDKFVLALDLEKLKGEMSLIDIIDKTGKLIVSQGIRINRRHIKLMEQSEIKEIILDQEHIFGKILANHVIDKETGEIIAEANSLITSEILEVFKKKDVKEFETLEVMLILMNCVLERFLQNPVVIFIAADTLHSTSISTFPNRSLIFYKVMRPQSFTNSTNSFKISFPILFQLKYV